MQTGKHAANVGSRLKLAWKPGRRHLKSQPSSRIGENPPYKMIGGIEETSASFEARSAPRSYPTVHAATPRRHSEIRLVGGRDRRILSVIVFTPVFGADPFRPFAQGAPIGYGRRPGHVEDAFILDREFELHPLAPIL